MKKFFADFKAFAIKGNVIDLSVAVIIGASFQGIVSSLTDNIISPIVGLFTRQNFDSLSVTFLGVTLRYGAFLTSIINFFIMAFVIFLLVRIIKKITSIPKKDESAAITAKTCPYCFSSIHINATRCPNCTSVLD